LKVARRTLLDDLVLVSCVLATGHDLEKMKLLDTPALLSVLSLSAVAVAVLVAWEGVKGDMPPPGLLLGYI
jgi:predicted cupin superfamily sugar epimerase